MAEKKTPGAEVEPRPGIDFVPDDPGPDEPVEGEVVPDAPEKRQHDTGIMQYVTGADVQIAEDPDAVYRRIIQEVLASPTIEDVLTPIDATSLREMVGQIVTILDWSVQKSEYEAGAPAYFSIQVMDETTHTRKVLNTGEQRVMAQLIRLKELDAFPCKVLIGQGRTQNNYGSYPMRLETP